MAKIQGLIGRKDTYYIRVRIPNELRLAIGKTEIVKSLKTKDYTIASQRIHLERVKIESEFEVQRQKIATSSNNQDMLSNYDE